MKLFLTCYLLFFCNIIAVAQTENFDRLKQIFQDGQVFVADYQHVYMDSYTKDTVRSTGKIWISEDAYKVVSNDQTILVNGETSKVYDRYRNRVIISHYDPAEDDFAPSRMLNGSNTNFNIQESDSSGVSVVNMISEDDFSTFQQVQIRISGQQIPVSIIAFDFAENKIVTRFKNGSFLRPGATSFELEFPDDAEIIDMRAQ